MGQVTKYSLQDTMNGSAASTLSSELLVAGVGYKVSVQSNETMQEHYAASENENDESVETNTLLGEANYFDNTIIVNEILERQRRHVILVHELTHAIFYEAGFDEQDEDMINRVGKVLYQVLKDNDFSFLRT